MKTLGPWEIIRRLGAGGSAEVFLARPQAGGDEVALKVLLPHLADDPAHVSMLLREARAVGPLSHPNIAALLETGEVEGRTFLAMELVRGAPLSTVLRELREARDTAGKVSLGAAAYLVREAAKGLHHAHEKELIHRDVSPHNLMVSVEGAVKVVDFGLARATHDGATATGGLKGKLRYMPPEQVRVLALDRRADVFALGAVLWELALGQPLYAGATEADVFQQALVGPKVHPDELVFGLPRAFVDVLMGAVAGDREKRTATALKLAEALGPFVTADAAEEWSQRVHGLAGAAEWKTEPSRVGDRPPVPTDPGLPAHVVAEPARTAPPLQPMPKKKKAPVQVSAAVSGSTGLSASASRDEEPSEVSSPATPRRRSLIALPRFTSPEFRASRGKSIRRGIVVAIPIVAAVSMFVLDKLDIVALGNPPSHAALEISEPGPEEDSPPDLGEDVVATGAPSGRERGASSTPAVGADVREPSVLVSKGGARGRTPSPGDAETVRRPESGTLVLTASTPAFVKAGAVELGMTPVTAQLPAGRQLLELTSPDGKQSARVEVDVPRGGTVERRVTLRAK